jgi:sugar phosphate isomerase/epimerase
MNAKGDDSLGLESLELYKAAGCDYIEVSLSYLMTLDKTERAQAIRTVANSGMPCDACNNFMPASIKVTGPVVDEEKIREYVKSALGTAATLGAKVIVFGSGGARNFPSKFPRAEAEKQFASALTLCGDLAESYKIDFVIEHLNRLESNLVNTLSEALDLAKQLHHPRVHNLVDLYHFGLGNEDLKIIAAAKGRIKHAHIANLLGRAVPVDSREWDYAGFFRALFESGYTGRVSVEGYTSNIAADFAKSVSMLKALAG